MNFDTEKVSFLDYLRVERGLAENSVIAYRRDLERFQRFLHARELTLRSIHTEHVIDYQRHMREQGLAQASADRNISALRTFFAYLAREKQLTNPMSEIEKSRVLRKLPKALTLAEVLSLIGAAYRESDPLTLRNRALIELLYGTGGRVSEVVGLDLADFSRLEAGGDAVETIKLRGKGGKERVVPLGSFASAAVQEYLVRIRPDLAKKAVRPSAALFLNQRGGRLTRQSAWEFVTSAAEVAGIQSRVSPHVFRHSYATHLLDGGADIRVVQELLGHSSVTTTQIYTLITIDKVRESYSMSHPRARG